MNLWNRKSIAVFMLIIGSVFFLFSLYTPIESNPDSNFDRISNYLYSTPVILKRIKAIFSFSDLPIFEVTLKKALVNSKNTTAAINSRAQIVPSPTPVATKTAVKSENKTKESDGETNRKPRLVVETFNYKDDDLGKDKLSEELPIAAAPAPVNPPSSTDKTIADWRYRLYMNPSKENMNTFVHEYLIEKVTKEVFYTVIKSLLNESDEKSQAIAIYGLGATPSYRSYEMLVLKIDEKSLKRENQNLAQKNIESYSNPENIKILLTALKSSQEAVTLQALRSVGLMVEHKDFNTPTQNISNIKGRGDRGLVTLQIKTDSYADFVSELRELAHNSNSQVANLAENTLKQFEQATSSYYADSAANETPTASQYR